MSNKIELFIQARKGGYKILYPYPTPQTFYNFASDIQSGNAKENFNFYCKRFYSISFSKDQPIFSTYVVVYDEQRGHIGNVGFSISVANGYRLQSVYLRSLLDELSKTYINKYCPGPNYRLGESQENWEELTNIVQSYEEKLNHHESNDHKFISGELDPALLYYSNERELDHLLGDPYFDEFIPFKQVFLIDETDKGEYDPSNLIKHCNQIIQPDYENKKLYLKKDSQIQGLTLKAFANNHWKNISWNFGENIIQTSWMIHLQYKSPDPGFEDIDKKGKVNDPDLKPFFEIHGTTIKPIINSSQLIPKRKEIKIQVSGYKPEDYSELEIIINGRRIEKGQVEITEVFQGDDYSKTFYIQAIDDKNSLSSERITIKPYEDTKIIRLHLVQVKKITISAFLENDHNAVGKFRIITIDSLLQTETIEPDNKGEISLRNRYNNQPFSLKVETNRNNVELVGEKRNLFFHDINSNIAIPLRKKARKQYDIDAGKHGRKKSNCPAYSEFKDGRDVQNFISPNTGYKLIGFAYDENEGKITAEYNKNKAPLIPLIIILGLLIVIGSAVYLIFPSNEKSQGKIENEKNINIHDIAQYIEGIELQAKKLDSLKNAVLSCTNDSIIINQRDSLINRINRALDKRKFINAKDFRSLDSLRYSTRQLNFKTSISKISDDNLDSLKYLPDLSKLNLDVIAHKIDSCLNKKSVKQTKVGGVGQQMPPTTTKSELEKYLEGQNLSKEQLLKINDSKLTRSQKTALKLCIEFADEGVSRAGLMDDIIKNDFLSKTKMKTVAEYFKLDENKKAKKNDRIAKFKNTLKP